MRTLNRSGSQQQQVLPTFSPLLPPQTTAMFYPPGITYILGVCLLLGTGAHLTAGQTTETSMGNQRNSPLTGCEECFPWDICDMLNHTCFAKVQLAVYAMAGGIGLMLTTILGMLCLVWLSNKLRPKHCPRCDADKPRSRDTGGSDVEQGEEEEENTEEDYVEDMEGSDVDEEEEQELSREVLLNEDSEDIAIDVPEEDEEMEAGLDEGEEEEEEERDDGEQHVNAEEDEDLEDEGNIPTEVEASQEDDKDMISNGVVDGDSNNNTDAGKSADEQTEEGRTTDDALTVDDKEVGSMVDSKSSVDQTARDSPDEPAQSAPSSGENISGIDQGTGATGTPSVTGPQIIVTIHDNDENDTRPEEPEPDYATSLSGSDVSLVASVENEDHSGQTPPMKSPLPRRRNKFHHALAVIMADSLSRKTVGLSDESRIPDVVYDTGHTGGGLSFSSDVILELEAFADFVPRLEHIDTKKDYRIRRPMVRYAELD